MQIRVPIVGEYQIREVRLELDEENGAHVARRIEEKVTRLMMESGREATSVLIDAKSYLDLKHYCTNDRMSSRIDSPFDADFVMMSSVGPLTFTVLPQQNKRIQVLVNNQNSISRYIQSLES